MNSSIPHPHITALVALNFVFALGGCAIRDYRYVTSDNHPEAVYQAPKEKPSGSVRLRSLGAVDLRKKGETKRVPSLHMRMSISNTKSQKPWRLDTREQVLVIPRYPGITPLFVNSTGMQLPKVEILPGEFLTLDLFYAIPDPERTLVSLNEFEVHWSIDAGDEKMSETSSFILATGPTEYPDYYPNYPYSPTIGPVWYEPPVIPAPSMRTRK